MSQRVCMLGAGFLVCAVLTGCAAQMAYREGKGLVEQGKIEEGLIKLQEAVTHDPRSAEYKSAYLQTRDHALTSFVEQADRLAQAGKSAEAKKLYQRTLVVDPNNERALAGIHAIDAEPRHAQLLEEAQTAWGKKDAELAQLKLRSVLAENPRHTGALALKRLIAEKSVAAPAESALTVAFRKPISIEFKDVALKQVFEVISRTSGLNFLFDKDVKTDQKTSIFLKNSTIASAVHFTLLTNQLEQQVLDGNTILVYPNTVAKLKDYQEMVVKTFFLTNAEAKTVGNTLKTIVKTRDVVIDDKLNMLIVRDSPEAIRLAEKLVALHDVPEPEVMLEVEILEIKRTRLLDLGIRWPDTLTLTPIPSTTGGALTLRDLRTGINSGSISAGISPVTINAKKTDTDANILANPRIRARNHEKAKIMIGERVPNITVTGNASAAGFVSESINYVDVGLKLEVEPTVYLDGDVAIKISLEVSNIVSQIQTKSGSVAYQIGTRNASTTLRLRDGENQVLAGLINDEDRRNTHKLPGFGDIPVVGRLFGSTNDDSQKTEIVLSITPRLIRNIQRPEASLAEFRGGTESSFRVRPDAITAPTSQPSVGATSPGSERNVTPAVNPAVAQPAADVNGGKVANTAGAMMKNSAPSTGDRSAQASAALLQWQGPAQVRTGETFALQLTIKSDQPVLTLPFAVGFDNKLLQVVGVTEGDFLKQDGGQTDFTSRVDPNGQILITSSRSAEGSNAAPGIVATINFRALASADISRIQLLTVSPVGTAGRSIAATLPLPHSLQIQP